MHDKILNPKLIPCSEHSKRRVRKSFIYTKREIFSCVIVCNISIIDVQYYFRDPKEIKLNRKKNMLQSNRIIFDARMNLENNGLISSKRDSIENS